jgi:general secretion pathway protein K
MTPGILPSPRTRGSIPTTLRRQRGVALIMAVLIVALATMLAASVSFKGYLDQRRSGNAFALDQGFEVALGGEAWAADSLRRDKQQSSPTDDFTEEWATPIPPIPIDNGQFEGQMEDMQGRFNLNSLVTLEGGQLKFDQPAIDRFERLLELLELETKWARIIADWIDSDIQPNFPDGAEDPTYTGLSPPYRTANMPLTRASELLAITGFGLERYRKLEPFVTALPIGTSINLCTASPELLDALVAGRRQFTLARDDTMETRKQRCFPTKQDYESGLQPNEKTELVDGKVIDQTSSYFRSTIWVTIGTTQFTLYSLLYRSGNNGLVRPILRSHGTP